MEKTFKAINPVEYVINAFFESGRAPVIARKHAQITAVRGEVGEIVKTVLKNGTVETVNTVKIDSETGRPGWIVTGIGGERYVIEDSEFTRRYKAVPEKENTFNSTSSAACTFRVDENVKFTAPWGQELYLEKGGYLVCNDVGDIWGVAKDEFESTYTECIDSDKDFRFMLSKSEITLLSYEETKAYYAFVEFLVNTKDKGSTEMIPENEADKIRHLMLVRMSAIGQSI